MAISLTPLDHLGLLQPAELERLRSNDVRSVEEVVGLLESSPDDVAALLDWTPSHANTVLAAALASLPDETRELLTAARGRDRAYGARIPGTEDGVPPAHDVEVKETRTAELAGQVDLDERET